jgi:O-antigen/teichoic acid export membrane protein
VRRTLPEASLSTDTAVLFAGRMAGFAVTFAVPLVLVRVFSTADFGLYRQLFLVSGTLAPMLALGFPASLFYFVPRDPEARPTYVMQTLIVLLASGVLGGGVLLALRSPVALALNNPEVELYLPWIAFFLVVFLVAMPLENLMVVSNQVRLASAAGFLSDLARGTLLIGAAVLTGSMHAVVLAMILWAGLRLAALLVHLTRLGIIPRRRPNFGRIGEQSRYALPFGAAVVVGTLAENLHQYLVSYLYGPLLFAVYSVSYLQIPVVGIAFDSSAELTLVRVTTLRTTGQLPEASRLIRDAISRLCLAFFPLYVWLIVASHDIILLLYTDRFEQSVGLFRIFLTMVPLTAVALDYVPRAFAATRFILWVNLARAALGAGLLLALVKPLGLVGAALAVVLTKAVTSGIVIAKVCRLLGAAPGELFPSRKLAVIAAASGVSGLGAWAAQQVWGDGLAGRLVISAACSSVLYALMIWQLGFLGASDKTWILGKALSWTGRSGKGGR